MRVSPKFAERRSIGVQKGMHLRWESLGAKAKRGKVSTGRERGAAESLGTWGWGGSQNQREAGKEEGRTGQVTHRNWSSPSRGRTEQGSLLT